MQQDQPEPPIAPSALERLGLRARKLAEIVSALMFLALFLTFIAQVFWRYVLREPLVWTLEVAGLLFVTLSLFTAATQMPFRDHVRFDLFLDLFPPGRRRVLVTLSLGLFAVVMLASLPDTFRLLPWMFRERTMVLRLNEGYLFVLMIFFVLAYVIRALWQIWRMWRQGTEAGD